MRRFYGLGISMLSRPTFLMDGDGGGASGGAGAGAGAGTGAGAGGAGTGSEGGAGEGNEPPAKLHTQDEVNAIATREAAKAERKALETVAQTLGMSVEDAKKYIDGVKQQQLEAMNEADRKTAEAAERERKAGETESKAAQREHDATVMIALLGAEVPAKVATDVAKLLDVKVGDDEKAIGEAVVALKARLPQLFDITPAGEGEGEGGPEGESGGAPSGDAANRPKPKPAGKPGATTDALQRGKDRAAKVNADRGIPVPSGATQ